MSSVPVMKCWEQYSDEETMVGWIWKKTPKENQGEVWGTGNVPANVVAVVWLLDLKHLWHVTDNFFKIEVFTFAANAQYFQLEDCCPTPHLEVSLTHAKLHAICMLQLIFVCPFFILLLFWTFILSWIVAELVGTGQQKGVCVLVRGFFLIIWSWCY